MTFATNQSLLQVALCPPARLFMLRRLRGRTVKRTQGQTAKNVYTAKALVECTLSENLGQTKQHFWSNLLTRATTETTRTGVSI